ncbi:uncharacterized protein Dana_GF27211 [Drosophila ananassae]|uniref:Uncharacterized protein n=1 Tax=Drosophila ananassae TaxID=7217 RepID=A0A0P9AM52_DROAN|nr:uncharacterized protein Dana_GF27211 [Drosophila ananassae]
MYRGIRGMTKTTKEAWDKFWKLHTVSHFRWKIENTRPGIWLPFEITVIFAFGQGFANLSAAYVWLQPPLKLPHVQLAIEQEDGPP